jgi:hypothetical protein
MAFRRRIQMMAQPLVYPVVNNEPTEVRGSLCHDGIMIKPGLRTSLRELQPSLSGTITVKPGINLVSELNC